MGRSLWVHAEDKVEKQVPVFLNEVDIVGKECTTGDIGVPDLWNQRTPRMASGI